MRSARPTSMDGPNGEVIRIELNPDSLSPGWHGLHLHAVGTCEDVGEFKESGGHHGKVEGAHGLLNPKGPEAGDLPNIWVAADGSAGYEAFTRLTALDSCSMKTAQRSLSMRRKMIISPSPLVALARALRVA